MKVLKTRLDGITLLEPQVFGDERGFFLESWNRKTFSGFGINGNFVQDNHSRSAKGILRGLHFQLKHPQGKLVWVVSGEVFDVAVDLRKGSPTFGEWEGTVLSEANRRRLWVPPGFAHGFLVMSESADFLYKCTDYYAPEHERTLRWDDPHLAIDWPLDGAVPALSEKDQRGTDWADLQADPPYCYHPDTGIAPCD